VEDVLKDLLEGVEDTMKLRHAVELRSCGAAEVHCRRVDVRIWRSGGALQV